MKGSVFAFMVFLGGCVLTGCGHSDASSETSEQQAQKQQQAISRVQSDSKMPPEVKQKVLSEMQAEAARRKSSRQ